MLMLSWEEEELGRIEMISKGAGTDSFFERDSDISDTTLDISTKQSGPEPFDQLKSR